MEKSAPPNAHRPTLFSLDTTYCMKHKQKTVKLVIYQQMHYLLHLERFNFTQKII
jgi:hypothetical protein